MLIGAAHSPNTNSPCFFVGADDQISHLDFVDESVKRSSPYRDRSLICFRSRLTKGFFEGIPTSPQLREVAQLVPPNSDGFILGGVDFFPVIVNTPNSSHTSRLSVLPDPGCVARMRKAPYKLA